MFFAPPTAARFQASRVQELFDPVPRPWVAEPMNDERPQNGWRVVSESTRELVAIELAEQDARLIAAASVGAGK